MRIAALLLVCAALGSCSSSSGDDRSSGVAGTVVSGPHCPVERADSPCPDTPVAGAVVVALDLHGNVVNTDTADDDGRFGMFLRPGRYRVTVQGLHGIQSSKVVACLVRPGRFTDVTVLVDTGIR